MSKGTILTSGYINLTDTLRLLIDAGYKVVKLHGVKETIDSVNYVDESEVVSRYMIEELEKDGFTVDKNCRAFKSITDTDLISHFSIGGRYYKDDPYLVGIIDNEIHASIAKANSIYRYIIDSNKRYNYIAALFHADHGCVGRSSIIACKELGIPTFVCYNGSITECAPRFSALHYYNAADVYYLHGQYAEDWISHRYTYAGGYPVVGQPSFDYYYTVDAQPEENTFLFSSKTVFSQYEDALSGLKIFVDKAYLSMLATKLPSDMDGSFLSAFAKFQANIYPEARLIISLRPYHSASKEDYINYAHRFKVKNFDVIPYTTQPIKELIPKSKYVVTGASTVAIEGVVNRKGVVLLPGDSDYSSYRYEDRWSSKAADMSEDAIVDSLCRVIECEEELVEACNEYAPYFNYGDDGKASERIAEDLIRRVG